jgi:trans-aconitate methyltransferase
MPTHSRPGTRLRGRTAPPTSSVARHLGIDLREYDSRIQSFIPGYDAMLDAAAAALRGDERVIVDLGVGTGALAARCLRRSPHARLVGIDRDQGMLRAAAGRLGDRATLRCESFMRAEMPRCDAFAASLALHHVRTRAAKRRLYERLRLALRPRGRLLIADCCPAADAATAAKQREAWRAHLRRSYTARETAAYFAAWADEDVYVPLADELRLLGDADFRPEVVWREGPFAVVAAMR